jgi:sodium/potassium-transporting ATPase subunit alpha
VTLRDGEKLTIKADELTVGDIVEIKFGDRVPADIRVLEARSFKVSNLYNLIVIKIHVSVILLI